MFPSFRFAHLSDLHFFHMSFKLKSFLSKRLIGNCNFLLRRKNEFKYELLEAITPVLVREKISFVVISGDISCTSLEEEFIQGKRFVEGLKKLGIETIVVPGNHDKYTKESAKSELFYQSFPSPLSEDGIEVKKIAPSWSLVAIDTALPTPFFCCHGKFSEDLKQKLDTRLKSLPENESIVLTSHFPIALDGSKALHGESSLLSLCKKYKNIKLYLHGHTHTPKITDKRAWGLPVIVDSGSAVHRFAGGWNIIECKETECSISPFKWTEDNWTPSAQSSFSWTDS